MKKNEIISRVEEFLHNKYDAGGIDSELVEDCVDSTLAAINYTHSCTELKTFDIHECINEVTKSANKLSPWIVDARKDRSFRYRVKKAIDKMLYSN